LISAGKKITTGTSMPRASLIIVEDEPIVATELQGRLKSLDYEVKAVVATGEEAIESARKYRPDLFLMDIFLTGSTDGITAAKKIKELYDIPSIYLTSYSDDTIINRARITEPYGYILKPFGDREVHTHIEIALYRFKAEKEKERIKNKLIKTLSELEESNKNLDKRIKEEIKKNREKDYQITLNAMRIFNCVTLENLDYIFRNEGSISDTQKNKMKKVLQSFADLSLQEKQKNSFLIHSVLKKALSYLEAKIRNYNIRLDLSGKEDISVDGFENQFVLGIFIILNTIIDLFKEEKEMVPLIKIKSVQGNEGSYIQITDNFSWIDPEILKKTWDTPDVLENDCEMARLHISKILFEHNSSSKLNIFSKNPGMEYIISL
jgi:DNA-binding NarL/FixJ family response regulator